MLALEGTQEQRQGIQLLQSTGTSNRYTPRGFSKWMMFPSSLNMFTCATETREGIKVSRAITNLVRENYGERRENTREQENATPRKPCTEM
jgi:hypothetical protein